MVELYVDKKCPERGSIDLHGFHPRDDSDELYAAIRDGLCKAHDAGLRELTIIHGHGHNRVKYGPASFVNSNTGWLGQTVRSILRNDRDLRRWMFAKFECSHDGSTTVRLRQSPP